MTNFDRIRQMSVEEFTDWLEDFAEAYVSFWIMPFDQCDFSHRQQDKTIQLHMLRSEYSGGQLFKF